MDNRTPRAQETRAKETRAPTTFVPSGVIPRLESENPDYVYRWIRCATREGKDDAKNMSARFREGWVPVKKDEFPELLGPVQDLGGHDSRYDGMVRHAELILCKIPKDKAEARRRYYRELASRQLQSIDQNYFKENDRRMPMFKDAHSVVGSRNNTEKD